MESSGSTSAPSGTSASANPESIAHRTVMISLVIFRHRDDPSLFLTTNEKRGWYLCAGRVDFGETFPTGAIRESAEEAGVEARLLGVYRIEHSPWSGRIRVVFAAEQANEGDPKPTDDEVISAEYLSIAQVRAKKVRSREVWEMFQWVQDGTAVFPMSLLSGEDGPLVDSKKVVTNLFYRVSVLVQRDDGCYLLFRKGNDSDGEIMLHMSDTPRRYRNLTDLAKREASELLYAGDSSAVGQLSLLRFHHVPPVVYDGTGSLTVVYGLKVSTKEVDALRVLAIKGWESVWMTSEELKGYSGRIDPLVTDLVQSADDCAAWVSTSVLTHEGASYTKLPK